MNTRVIGSVKEDLSILYLQSNGFEIIERNFKCKIGEIDIIAKKDNIIRFIEVKYRKNTMVGGAYYAINKTKLQKISKIANYYILTKGLRDYQLSIDALLINGEDYEYIENIYGGM